MSEPIVTTLPSHPMERRAFVRYLLLFDVVGLFSLLGHRQLPCRLLNVSLGGARIGLTLPSALTSDRFDVAADASGSAHFQGHRLPGGALVLPITCRRVTRRSAQHVDVSGSFESATVVTHALLEEWASDGRALGIYMRDGAIRIHGRLSPQYLWRLDAYTLQGAPAVELESGSADVADELRRHLSCPVRVVDEEAIPAPVLDNPLSRTPAADDSF